ncbi:PspC domain-containing protein [Kibdelosporangium philippinense]|uniref:PspC domain-containing protein n=1 Tax=Kibdelosporangium philippinense TaxID=211113 RepID=A0ABS8ZDR6_9PSEU|nr:PspC domain-containing protein [Kibdelosporangium philippinense]MCE7005991.1 PspC domain-containing protein [Kibdelosporangium philippinense]
MSGTQRQQGQPFAGAEDTLKDFWTNRPRRPRHGRKIAGVAAGIANRYQIDPILVRVLLVVSAIVGGAGLVIYVLGWLFFPDEADEEAPLPALIGRGRSHTGWFFTLLLCAVLFGASLYTFNGVGGEGVVGLALLLTALFLLHRGRGGIAPRQTPPPAAPSAQPTMPLGMDVNAQTTEVPVPPQPEQRTSPPAWDPLGAAPFAWDLPDPAQPSPEPPALKRRRSPVGGVTLGAALAVGGVCALIAPQVSWLTPGHIIGIVLAIIGLGMVGGSLMGGGRGLIGLAVPLAMAGFVFTTASNGPAWVDSGQEWGTINVRPTTVDMVAPNYGVGGGTIDLDLTALPDTGVVHTSLNVGLGNISVLVPPNADVHVTCDAELGSVACLGNEQNATNAHISTADNGTDGAGGLKIYLDARVNTGDVEVRRG